MAIRVQAPNGDIVEFPDGTADDVMSKAMSETYGKQSASSDSAVIPGKTDTGVAKLISGQSGGNQLSNTQDGSVSADNLSRSFATGAPIIGGLLNKLDAVTNATLAPVVDPLLPNSFQKLPGKTWGDRYQQALDIQQGKDQAFHEQHPYVDTATQLAGGVAATIPAVVAAPGLFGAGTASLPTRVAIGGATGGAIGGTDAAIRSEGDPVSTAVGTGVGTVLGAAGPAVGEVAGNIYRNITGRAATNAAAEQAGVSRPAVDVVARSLGADNALADTSANIAAAGPRAMLADAGPSTLSTLDTAIQRGGPGAGQAAQRVGNRAAGAAQDVNQALDTAFGPSEGMVAPLEALRTSTQPARAAAYDAAYATPIDYASSTGQALQNVVENRVPASVINRANNLMRVNGEQSQQILANIADDGTVTFQRLPDVRQLDYITRALNDVSRAGDGNGALGGNTAEGRAYGNLARTIRDMTSSLVPEYRTALNTAAEPIAQREATLFGQRLLSPTVSRDEAQAFVAGMSDAELRSLRGGVRSKIAETLANVKRAASDPNVDARQGVQAIRDLSSDAAREKLATILGQDEADSFFRAVDQAARSFDLRAGVAANSRTYARQAATRAVDEATAPGPIETLATGRPVEAGRTMLQRLLGVGPEAQLGRQDAAWADIANLLTQPVDGANSSFFQAIQGAANRLPVIDRTASAITRNTASVGGVLAPQASRLAAQGIRQ